jgi:hypothetical protein
VVTAMAALHGSSFRYGVIINGFAGGRGSYMMPGQSVEPFLAVKGDVNKVRVWGLRVCVVCMCINFLCVSLCLGSERCACGDL